MIPDDYIHDVHTRLGIYKRLSSVDSGRGFDELQVELIDRFGLIPEALKQLIRVTKLRLQAENLGIAKIEANAQQGKIEFIGKPLIDPLIIVNLVQSQPQIYQLRGAGQLIFKIPMFSAGDRLETVESLLNHLQTGH
ncbi:MAG: transcription-repair coupling factor (superfamily II helicase) [Cellvibrionaceae bacterium]